MFDGIPCGTASLSVLLIRKYFKLVDISDRHQWCLSVLLIRKYFKQLWWMSPVSVCLSVLLIRKYFKLHHLHRESEQLFECLVNSEVFQTIGQR